MYYLFEEGQALHLPVECFYYDSVRNSFPVKPHWHYFMEMLFMTEGSAEVYAGEKHFLLSPGDMMIFMPETVHSIYAAADKPPTYSVIKFDINRLNISSDYTPKLRSIYRAAQKKDMDIFFDSAAASGINAGECFERCISEMYRQDYGYDMVIRAEISKLLTGVIRLWKQSGFSVDSEIFAEDEHFDIYSITEYIDRNLTNGVKVADIAEKCGLSYSYFAKKFPAVYGKTCKEYIEEIRIYKVEEFLMFTDFDLTYIAQETGFSDCSHMIKSFVRYKGITPKQFRLAHIKRSG